MKRNQTAPNIRINQKSDMQIVYYECIKYKEGIKS